MHLGHGHARSRATVEGPALRPRGRVEEPSPVIATPRRLQHLPAQQEAAPRAGVEAHSKIQALEWHPATVRQHAMTGFELAVVAFPFQGHRLVLPAEVDAVHSLTNPAHATHVDLCSMHRDRFDSACCGEIQSLHTRAALRAAHVQSRPG